MNQGARLLSNDIAQADVPALETARRPGMKRPALALSPMALLLGALLASTAGAQALPTGAQVVAGQANVHVNGHQMTITQTTPKAIVHWQGFDIGSGSKVQFNQPGASAIALNRVVAGNASRIDGQLGANGQVWLVNPNGVVFGQGSQVNVGGLVASTLDIANEDFHAGRQVFARGAAQGGITNQGNITVADGATLALLASHVKNEGTLKAHQGNVVLAGGDRVTLQAGVDGRLQVAVDPATVRTLIENQHLILADGGQVVMSASAADALSAGVVANTGTVQARTLDHKEGRILLLADGHGEVRHDGLLDASAPDGGNGGLVETRAAKVTLPGARQVTTQAADGATGTWLIDSNDYTIAAADGDVSGAQLSADLAATNVVIDTTRQGTRGGNGDIYVDDAVAWSANRLTLNARRNIHVDARMAVDGHGTLHLDYGNTQGNADKVPVPGSAVHVNKPVDFTQAGAGLLAINGHGYEVIHGVEGLQGIGAEGQLGGRYALGSSIKAHREDNFQPIGNAEHPFTGSFDGLGHTISHLTIVHPEQKSVGLFGQASNAALRNVKLKQMRVHGSDRVGALVGHHQSQGGSASVSNVQVSKATVSGRSMVGGLVGRNQSSGGPASVSNVQVSDSTVSGISIVGGLAGQNIASSGLDGVSISNAYSEAQVSGGRFIGGLVGANSGIRGTASIRDARAQGAVSGGDHLGGLVGINTVFDGGAASLNEVLATGPVSGGRYVGGLVGNNQVHSGSTAIRHAKARGEVRGTDKSVGALIGFNLSKHGLSSTMISHADATATSTHSPSAKELIGIQLEKSAQIHHSAADAPAGPRARPACARKLF